MVSSLIAVLLGSQVARFVTPATLHLVAGIGFVAIGVWMLINKA
jgi:putative Ca2+/H+ antiporter (TMEM165/GDT1 family)